MLPRATLLVVLSLAIPLPMVGQTRSWYLGAGPSGRVVRASGTGLDGFEVSGVSFRGGVERIAGPVGWTAGLGIDLGTGASAQYSVPLGAPCLPDIPCPDPVTERTVPAIFGHLRVGLAVPLDRRHRFIATAGPGLVFGDSDLSRSVVAAAVSAVMIQPLGSDGRSSPLAIGLEVTRLLTPLGAGVTWLLAPMARIRI